MTVIVMSADVLAPNNACILIINNFSYIFFPIRSQQSDMTILQGLIVVNIISFWSRFHLKCSRGLNGDKLTLVQVMAWCWGTIVLLYVISYNWSYYNQIHWYNISKTLSGDVFGKGLWAFSLQIPRDLKQLCLVQIWNLFNFIVCVFFYCSFFL